MNKPFTNGELDMAYAAASNHIAAIRLRGDLKQYGSDSVDYILIPVTSLEESY